MKRRVDYAKLSLTCGKPVKRKKEEQQTLLSDITIDRHQASQVLPKRYPKQHQNVK